MAFFKNFGTTVLLTFRLLRVMMQTLRGVWIVSRLKQPCVSIFGGTYVPLDSPLAKDASDIAAALVESDMSVLTGGGAGIMQAANCGAYYARKGELRTLGIIVRGIHKGGVNPCAREVSLVLDYFFARKYLLIHYSAGFIIFPGGIGTMDELAELLTMIQMKQRPDAAIVLIGVAFWQSFIDWLKLSNEEGLVDKHTIDRIKVTDDKQFVIDYITTQCREMKIDQEKDIATIS